MKITTWNCNGALRNKLVQIERLDADVIIVQECEDPKKSTQMYKAWAINYIWEGENKNKGIGVFAKPGIKLERLNWSKSLNLLDNDNPKLAWKTSELRQFIPFSINDKYTCVAVWTKGRGDEVFGYMGQFWKFLQLHKTDLAEDQVLVAGDFNSNKIWDKPDRWWSHTDVVHDLNSIGLVSLYHLQNNESQGQEKTPTLFHQRNVLKPYHIDYIFAGKVFQKDFEINVGREEIWLGYSDHMPVSLLFHNNK